MQKQLLNAVVQAQDLREINAAIQLNLSTIRTPTKIHVGV